MLETFDSRMRAVRQLISFTLTSPSEVVLVDSLVLCSDAAEVWVFAVLASSPAGELARLPRKARG